MALLSLDELFKNELGFESKVQAYFAEGKIVSIQNSCGILWSKNVVFSVYFINKMQYDIAKNKFFICGILDAFSVEKFNNRIFDYGLHHISYAVLSDNEPLIQRYAKLRYHCGENAELSMDEMVAIGEEPIWCNTIQFFMANDKEGAERNLNLIETKTKKITRRKEWDLMNDDYEFYKALHAGDKAKAEEVLEKLVSPKIHRKRNDNPVLNKYISLPALGYAKLAWRRGMEVEVASKLVPKDLLPIQPLEKYEIPYDFLKE